MNKQINDVVSISDDFCDLVIDLPKCFLLRHPQTLGKLFSCMPYKILTLQCRRDTNKAEQPDDTDNARYSGELAQVCSSAGEDHTKPVRTKASQVCLQDSKVSLGSFGFIRFYTYVILAKKYGNLPIRPAFG